MNEKLTELVFVIDRSGSMNGLEEDTIGGINSLLKKQKEVEGKCLVSTILFNQKSEVIFDRVDLTSVREMTRDDYFASGSTALVDALGDAIHHIRNVHKYIREEDVPAKTMFIITTDGMENASFKYSSADVKKMVEEQKKKGWEFLFLGANIDAVETARHYGIAEDRAVQYHNDHKGVLRNFECCAETVKSFRRNETITKEWKKSIEDDYKSRKGN